MSDLAGKEVTEHNWIICRNADGEVMGAVSLPVLDMTAAAVEARAQRRRVWLEARYPGPAIGKDSEWVRQVAERKRAGRPEGDVS